MRKIIFSLGIILTLSMFNAAIAKTVQVESLNSLSTYEPSSELTVKFLDNIVFDDNFALYEGLCVKGKIVEVKSPKRLKRDATFTFVPVSYTDSDGQEVQINKHYRGKYATALDKGQLAKSAVLSVGSHFVKGLTQGVNLIEGVIKNTEGNRAKSGLVAVYKNSPVAYVEKGQDIEIDEHEVFILNFKLKSDETLSESNYESTTEGNEIVE